MAVMTRVAPVVFSLLFTFAIAAQTPDLRVTISAPLTARLGDTVTLTATITNAGNAPAPNTRASLRIIPGRDCDQHNIILGTLAPGEQKVISCTQQVVDFGLYFLEHTAGAETEGEPSALRIDNFAYAITERLTEGTDLRFWAGLLRTPKPALPMPLTLFYENRSRTPATNATMTITLSEGSFGTLPSNCTANGMRAVCALGTIAPAPDPLRGQAFEITVNIIAPDRSEASWSADVEFKSDQADETPESNFQRLNFTNYRTFFVREATDASLRTALFSAGTLCRAVPCLIAFRIPNDAKTKWHTIRLAEQLDWVRGLNLEIDGTTQTAYFGDTNPDGPEIEIDGSATTGDGLRVPSRCNIVIRGLTLNGFRESALHVHDGLYACPMDGTTTVERSYIGTDPTGMFAKPNGRGVYSASAFGALVSNNVISGNRQSAVYIERGRGVVANNIIGLNRRHDAPLSNGASGVYVAQDGSGTDVNDNYIGFNHHFGVAIDRRADFVALHGNSFQANGGLAIDWGLDGPATGGRVPAPVIRSATYANGVTTIEAEAGFGGSFPEVRFYASDAPDPSGYGEGQYFLGTTRAPFRIVVPQDLRGKWISATLTEVNTLQILRTHDNSGVWRTTTSEMGLAVQAR